MQATTTSPNRTSTPSKAAEVPKAFSLASGTAASPPTEAAAGRLHPVASMATTASVTGSCSGRSMEEGEGSNTQLGLPLDSTTDEDSHQEEEDLEKSFRNEEESIKITSCVDCGAGNSCSCFGGVASPARVNKRGTERAYSIKLGQAKGNMLDERFRQQQHLSSQALTVVPGDLSESPLSSSASNSSIDNKDYFVKRLAPEASELNSDEGSGQSLHLKQHKDNSDNPHLVDNHNNGSCSTKWHNAINVIRIYTCRFLRWLTHYAATYPWTCIGSIILISLTMLTVGLFTNFYIEVENYNLWPPTASLSKQHTDWYYYNSNFNYDTSYFDMIVHADGDNVLGQEGVRRTFEVIQAVSELEGYQEGCYWASMFGDEYFVGECKIHSVADFWNESLAIFEQQIESDQDAKEAMSARTYPNGMIVDEPRILGKSERVAYYGEDDDTYTQLESAQSYLIEFDLPWTNVTEDFELLCLERIQQLQDEWDQDPNNQYRIQMAAGRSYGDEFFRAIVKDIPLLPAVFTIMSAFCCFVFWKRDRVQSRMMLGVGAVVCILLSIITGYGLLFTFGVPFTPVTTMMPFLMFGIGLDDAFILYGSYNRTDPRKDPVKRIEETIDDVGLSISLTTLTSTLAFFMGVFSGIPAVSWVCWYAAPTIVIDFIYQITFFVALVVIDERRIQANRRDVCFWTIEPEAEDEEEDLAQGSTFSVSDDNSETPRSPGAETSMEKSDTKKVPPTTLALHEPQKPKKGTRKSAPEEHFADRFMKWFAKQILKPQIQGVVVTAFLIIFGSMLYCATQLTQEFDYIDMVPKDSYLRGYFGAIDDFSQSGIYPYVFFRDVDQSDPIIQDQMQAYIDDLTASSAISEMPAYFWLRDFKQFVSENDATLGNMTFNEQIGEFFRDPGWEDLYGEHVVISKEDGHVVESRCIAYVDVDMRKTKPGLAMLERMREVTSRQPINQDRDGGDWAFLTYSDEYHLLEFYNVVVKELILTTVTGVITVSIIGLIFIPHWTAILYVFPFITFLYIDMLGFLYLSGVQINAISYITLVMSIGLMVDFIMHILLRYYEAKGTREQRVVETLSTMGASILVGAISTFLGIMLLVFSTSAMINNIFVSFIGLVVFGVLHGLIFLPTLLAMVGPGC